MVNMLHGSKGSGAKDMKGSHQSADLRSIGQLKCSIILKWLTSGWVHRAL